MFAYSSFDVGHHHEAADCVETPVRSLTSQKPPQRSVTGDLETHEYANFLSQIDYATSFLS